MLNMLGIRLEPDLEARLTKLAAKTGRTKSYYAKEAIRAYLEDQEDYLTAIAALERNEETFSIEEIRKELGLEH